MRKQIDGLTAIVEHQMGLQPLSKSVFVFVNKRRDKLKMLCWEKNGFIIWYKRLERDQFPWFKSAEMQTRVLSVKELNWLLDGYDVLKMEPHQPLSLKGLSL